MKLENLKISAWFFGLLFIIGLSSNSVGDVLCVNDDGHVKVESICTPCCDEPIEACVVSNPNKGHEHHDDCDDCSDLPLESHKRLERISSYDFGLIHYSSNLLYLVNFNIDYTNSFQKYRNKEFSHTFSKEVDILISTTVIIC